MKQGKIESSSQPFPGGESIPYQPLDRSVARTLVSLLEETSPQKDPALLSLIAFASYRISQGDSCILLEISTDDPDKDALPALDPSTPKAVISPSRWEMLQKNPIIGSREKLHHPLILDGRRLYLQRFYLYERDILKFIETRLLRDDHGNEKPGKTFPEEDRELSELLERLFPERTGKKSDNVSKRADQKSQAPMDYQKLAARRALNSSFFILTGGPGTGKTTTVVKILTLHLQRNRNLRIAVVAPTGKAAHRLQEAMERSAHELPIDPELKSRIPTRVTTVHSLLGALPGSSVTRFNRSNPLPLDLLVADEASMIDLSLMAHIVNALPEEAAILLIGDHNQLASVESGAVLGELCRGLESSPLTAQSALTHSIVELRRNYRFAEDQGIARLAGAVLRGDSEVAMQVLLQGEYEDLVFLQAPGSEAIIHKWIVESHQWLEKLAYREPDDETILMCLEHMDQFRILTPLREGAHGVAGWNRYVELCLKKAGLLQSGQGHNYAFRPILVERNDRYTGLSNGDTGMLFRNLQGSRNDHQIYGAFIKQEKEHEVIKRFSPERIGQHETCYAMTVHKSQGSEFDHVLLALPPSPSPLLTRELLYTGITRAKKRLYLYATADTIRHACEHKTERYSGLYEAIKKKL